MRVVRVSKRAEKSLNAVPVIVARKFFLWKREVEEFGIATVRRIPGYHDEPLQGRLKGIIRSVRLSRSYRAFYRVLDETVECVLVEDINHHDYKKIERFFGI